MRPHPALALLSLAAATALGAQPAVPRVALSGVVYDSVARAPLAGAEVQLVRVDTAGAPQPRGVFVTTDSSGRFRASDVPAGTWLAGFFHPALDELGIQASPRRVTIAPGRDARIDLALPAPTSIVHALCGPETPGDTTAMLVGFVRGANGRGPREGATVRVMWTDFVLDRNGARNEPHRIDARTLASGWFGACGVPAGGTVVLRAVADGDSSGLREVDFGTRRLAHVDLYLGGTASLRGVVRTPTGRPIPSARVSIAGGGDSTVAGEDGTFMLARVPAGSQTIEARAVGYLPGRAPVDVFVGDVPTTTSIALVSVRAYLDTVRVTGKRVFTSDRNGFERRRRTSGTGSFLTRDQIDRANAFRTSDLLRRVPGVDVRPTAAGDVVLLRSMGSLCRPLIYLDGMPISIPDPTNSFPDDIDIVLPTDLDGVEVYRSQIGAPFEYSRPGTNCGSIVMWTHPPLPKPPKPPKEDKARKPATG